MFLLAQNFKARKYAGFEKWVVTLHGRKRQEQCLPELRGNDGFLDG
jgi:hypothetical protein